MCQMDENTHIYTYAWVCMHMHVCVRKYVNQTSFTFTLIPYKKFPKKALIKKKEND